MRYKFIDTFLRVIFTITFSMLIIQCSDDITTSPEPDKNWSYDGDTGPDHWAELNPDYWLASNGKDQSPINIVTNDAIQTDLPDIQFHYEASELEIENNGHAIEAIPHAGSYIAINNTRYDLLQYHFHSLSEHTVNGNHFPIEGHFVHQNGNGDLAVIGLFIKAGTENQNFKPMWDHLPPHEEEVYELTSEINADNLLPAERRSYQYSGSLTTPPCSEGVRWFVLAEPVEMSQGQISAFEAIYDHNYRPVQALNARQVLLD